MKDLSLYIHIPFCKQKCIYCNFNSFCPKENDISLYFEKLYREIKEQSQCYKDYIVKTIFIGGGTPSLVKFSYIKNLYFLIKKHFNINKDIEFTIECNPNSLTKQKIKNYKAIGINRFSIGLQAGQDNLLKMLNRPHTKKDFEKVIKELKQEGIENFNIDILLGIPNQSFEDIKQTLNFVLSFNPTSISAYGLIVEEDTPLFNLINTKKLIPISEEDSVKYYDYVCKELKKNGYKRYEVSNFAKKGKESIHNICYWQNGDYLGFGLSAHSKIGDKRFSNTDNFLEYINQEKHQYNEIYNLTQEEKFMERIMLTLRMEKGINIDKFNQEFGIDFLELKKEELNQLSKLNLIYQKGKYLKVTQKGYKFLNYII